MKEALAEQNTQTGLAFEEKTDLATFLGTLKGYHIDKEKVFYEGKLVARIFKKHSFYKFLEEFGIDWREHISKKLLPDDSFYVIVNNTMYIIECKYQQTAGSVDEKLQTCDFKRKQYRKLLAPANIESGIYVLA